MSDDLDLDDTPPAATSDGKPRPNSKKPKDDEQYETTANELRQFVETIEHYEAEKADIAESIKEQYSELKSRGYDGKAVRALIAERKKDRDALSELAAIKAIYRQALGMAALDDL